MNEYDYNPEPRGRAARATGPGPATGPAAPSGARLAAYAAPRTPTRPRTRSSSSATFHAPFSRNPREKPAVDEVRFDVQQVLAVLGAVPGHRPARSGLIHDLEVAHPGNLGDDDRPGPRHVAVARASPARQRHRARRRRARRASQTRCFVGTGPRASMRCPARASRSSRTTAAACCRSTTPTATSWSRSTRTAPRSGRCGSRDALVRARVNRRRRLARSVLAAGAELRGPRGRAGGAGCRRVRARSPPPPTGGRRPWRARTSARRRGRRPRLRDRRLGRAVRQVALAERAHRHLPVHRPEEAVHARPGRRRRLDQHGRGEAAIRTPTSTARPKMPETLFQWHGWSLSAPPPGKSVDPDGKSGGRPTSPARSGRSRSTSWPRPARCRRLRFGTRYRLRARAVDLAGNRVVPRRGRRRRMRPPRPSTGGSTPSPRPRSCPTAPLTEGEAANHLVIRSNFNTAPKAPTGRHTLPPKAAAPMVEAHGVFDKSTGVVDTSGYGTIQARDGATHRDHRQGRPQRAGRLLRRRHEREHALPARPPVPRRRPARPARRDGPMRVSFGYSEGVKWPNADAVPDPACRGQRAPRSSTPASAC